MNSDTEIKVTKKEPPKVLYHIPKTDTMPFTLMFTDGEYLNSDNYIVVVEGSEDSEIVRVSLYEADDDCENYKCIKEHELPYFVYQVFKAHFTEES